MINGRRGVGVELKPTYYRQAVANVQEAVKVRPSDTPLLDLLDSQSEAEPEAIKSDAASQWDL